MKRTVQGKADEDDLTKKNRRERPKRWTTCVSRRLVRFRTSQPRTIGEVGAVNRELEVRFGNRVNGLKLVERGPEIEAVVDVFETWIKKYPGDIILEKWVTDTLEATRGLILAAGHTVKQF
jgi:hypothetical protein